MLERLRSQIGTAGLIVAIVALVAALGGGAYAATGGSGSKATASAKGKQGPRGKTGKTGPAGPQGPAGPAGAAGPAGPAGPKGDTGAAGAPGAPGAPGKNGKDGQTGFTETLPSEATETGGWDISGATPIAISDTALSFAIPLENAIAPANVHFIDEVGKELPDEIAQTNCLGTAAAPSAEPGHLCIYLGSHQGEWEFGSIFTLDEESTKGASTAGAILSVFGAPDVRLWGAWAVTAS
jgi:collagen triple helix repeat protein